MTSGLAALAGHDSVEESSRRIRNYRYAIERTMRMLGGWIALTPELSAKLLLGRHVWDCAQQADALGKRLPELRARAQSSEPGSPGFIAFMDALEEAERPDQTVERLVGVYGILKPHLLATYVDHLDHVNRVYEPPTERLLLRLVEDERRHIAAGAVILEHLGAGGAASGRADARRARLQALLDAARGVTGAGIAASADPGVAPPTSMLNDDAREFIRLEQSIKPWPIDAGMHAAIAGLGEALAGQDPAAVRRWLAQDAIWDPEVHAGLARLGSRRHRLVAFAHVGRQRMVKIRLEGAAGAATVLARFIPGVEGWRAAVLDVAAIDLARPA
jgi:hypothetical protein